MMMMEDYMVAPTSTPTLPKQPSDTTFPTVYPDPPVYQHASKVGERTLWVVFVIMLLAVISFAVMAWMVPAAKRFHHSLSTLIVVIAGLSYFAMANHSGVIEYHRRVPEHHVDPLPPTHRHIFRDFYYARYIDWLLTTPLLLLHLCVIAGVSGATVFSTVAADVIMILTGWFANVSQGKGERWGWYTMGCIAFVWILYTVLVTGISAAKAKTSAAVTRSYTLMAGYLAVVWLAYPIVWAIAARRILSVDGEIIAYAVLDVLAKVVFGAWLLITLRTVPEALTEVGGFWTHGFATEGTIRIGDGDEA